MFGWRFKLKLILLCAGVILGLVAFVAFNSFGIDPETIYNAQDEMNVAIYDRARGYRYSGNEIYGIFNKGQEVENTEITEDGIVPPESDNGGGVYDPDVSEPSSDVVIQDTSSWIDVCDKIHKLFGSCGFIYKYGGKGDLIYNGQKVEVRTDCSGYVGFCLYVCGYASTPININSSASLEPYGFSKASVVSESDLKPGDVLAYDSHIEVYLQPDMVVYNWGGETSAENKYKGVTDVNSVVSYGTSGHYFNEILTVWRRQ